MPDGIELNNNAAPDQTQGIAQVMGWNESEVEETLAQVGGQKGTVVPEGTKPVVPASTNITPDPKVPVQQFAIPDDVKTELGRLKGIEQQFKELTPILKALKDDGLLEKLKGGEPKTIVEQLNLGEDFVGDFNEAITDPNSDSAKAFAALIKNSVGDIEGTINKAIGGFANKQNQMKSMSEQKDLLGISDDDINSILAVHGDKGNLDMIDLALTLPENKKAILEAITSDKLSGLKYFSNVTADGNDNTTIGKQKSDMDEFEEFLTGALTEDKQGY